MNALFHHLLQKMLHANPPDPSAGGGLIPSSQWDIGQLPTLPPKPAPQLPSQLPATQTQSSMPPPIPPTPPPGMPTSTTMSTTVAGGLGQPPMTTRPPIVPDQKSLQAFNGPTPNPPHLSAPSPSPLPNFSTPGTPLLGVDPGQGQQGPDNMAPQPEEPAPLGSTSMAPSTDLLAGSSPQMSIHAAGQEPSSGGDLVSLIKRLLHRG